MQTRRIELIEQNSHVRERMTPIEYKALQFPVRDGHANLAASRKLEILTGSAVLHQHVAGYFPHEARGFLERFVAQHYNASPQNGSNTESSMADRNKRHFPYLFKNLRTRIDGLLEVAEFSTYRTAFAGLETEYLQYLAQGRNLTHKLVGQTRTKERHKLYRMGFSNIFGRLIALLDELCAIGDHMQKHH